VGGGKEFSGGVVNAKGMWTLLFLLFLGTLPTAPPAASTVRPPLRKLYVDNTAGDSVSVIDLNARRVLHEIKVGSHPHGLGALPDQSRLFVSVESDHTVKVIDTASDAILASIPVNGTPNQLAVTPDGKWVYVAINDRGTADIISVAEQKVVKSVEVGPGPHNCYCPHSAQFVYVAAIQGQLVRQFDYAHGHVPVQTIRFDGQVRPLCVTRDDKRLFVALADLHGFAWADLRTGQQVARVERPLPPMAQRSKFAYLLTHGLELRPGDRELWVTSFIGNGLMVYDITGPSPRYLSTVSVGDAPNWLTFSPDGRYAYSANAGENSITIVDCASRQRIADVKVGPIPKRLLEVHPPTPKSATKSALPDKRSGASSLTERS
jgi:YVTN family beta-propeller protein